MINGINLSDPNQNQITFQPTINTVANSRSTTQTFSAEYGRNSGSIVNIATRSGANTWHGEAYEFLPQQRLGCPQFLQPDQGHRRRQCCRRTCKSPFKRNQFGGDGGGAIKKDKAFVYLSYEGLRQRQAVPLSATGADSGPARANQATSDPQVQGLVAVDSAAEFGDQRLCLRRPSRP